jgi:hypothetical protein
MKLTVSATGSLFALLFLCGPRTAKAQQAQDSTALPYLVQEVCIDQTGAVLRIDPYFCPKNDTLRQLQIGEPLPYHKHNQVEPHNPLSPQEGEDKDSDFELHDSYPVRGLNGNVLSIDPFDFEPDRFSSRLDGYDVYRIDDGWTSVEETRDSGGFGITWFGANCKLYNGWVFFPLADLSASGIKTGEVKMPISGVYWEKDGEHWPGNCLSASQASATQSTAGDLTCHPGASCPSKDYENPLTSWEFIPNYPFAGIGNNPVKRLDTIRSIHGFIDSPDFLAHGDLEVFYFTKLYGSTRWEDWMPVGALKANRKAQRAAEQASKFCHGTDDVEYHGVKFVVTFCRDWSAVSVLDKPELAAPWPVPDLNLLQNFHFDQGLANWKHTESGNALQLSLKTSTAARDMLNVQRGGAGVRYLALSCAADCSAANAIYQDVPVTPKTTSGRYTLGSRVSAEGHAGALRLAVTVLDRNGKVLDEKSFTEPAPTPGGTGADSVVLSGNFALNSFSLAIDPQASVLRFSISPTASGTFDIVDTWLMKDTY